MLIFSYRRESGYMEQNSNEEYHIDFPSFTLTKENRIVGFGDGASKILYFFNNDNFDKIIIDNQYGSNDPFIKNSCWWILEPYVTYGYPQISSDISREHIIYFFNERETIINTLYSGLKQAYFLVCLGGTTGYFFVDFLKESLIRNLFNKNDSCVFAQLPFHFEGSRRNKAAEKQLSEINNIIDNCTICDPNKLFKDKGGEITLNTAFEQLNKTMSKYIEYNFNY